MTGCIVKCSNVVHDAQGRYKTSALEFETLTLLGSNCAIASWEDVADLDRLCDEMGLPLDRMAWESQKVQIVNAVCDSSGFCQFLQPSLDDIRGFYAAFYGIPVSREAIHDLGWQCLSDEWEFNDGAGFTEADDRLAACMHEDAIGEPPTVFDVPREIIQAAKQRMPAREDLFASKSAG